MEGIQYTHDITEILRKWQHRSQPTLKFIDMDNEVYVIADVIIGKGFAVLRLGVKEVKIPFTVNGKMIFFVGGYIFDDILGIEKLFIATEELYNGDKFADVNEVEDFINTYETIMVDDRGKEYKVNNAYIDTDPSGNKCLSLLITSDAITPMTFQVEMDSSTNKLVNFELKYIGDGIFKLENNR